MNSVKTEIMHALVFRSCMLCSTIGYHSDLKYGKCECEKSFKSSVVTFDSFYSANTELAS